MIPKNDNEVISTLEGAFKTSNFKVAVNSKTFSILLDKLYTNKVAAPIRELWTNARDSHIECGKGDVPFECQLPNALNPTFRVRDFGVSLSPDQVLGLYTTVFETTKDHTNEQTGYLGLGSKSPFAYVSSFQVTTWKDGYKRLYVASMGTTGIPMISEISTELSDEPQGLEISFPVKSHDVQAFKREAEKLLLGFDVKPIISGNDVTPLPVLYQGNGWKILQGGKDGIRQGPIIYPVSVDQGVGTYLRCVAYNYSIVADVPIGSVDVAASREALSFDPDTIHNVQEAFRQADANIKAFVDGRLGEAKNTLQRAKVAIEFGNTFNYLNLKESGYIDLDAPKFNKKAKDKIVPRIYTLGKKDEKPTTKFHVKEISNMVFLVDDGRPLLRKTRRIQEFCRVQGFTSKSYWNSNKGYLVHITNTRQLERLIRLLGLHADQLTFVRSLEDPGPSEYQKKNVVLKRGVPAVNELSTLGLYKLSDYGDLQSFQQISGKTPPTPQTPEHQFYWQAIPKSPAPSDYVYIGGKGARCDNMAPLIGTVRRFLGKECDYFFLTPQAVKRYNSYLPRHRNLDHAIKTRVVKEWEHIHQAAGITRAFEMASRLSNIPTNEYTSEVVKGLVAGTITANPQEARVYDKYKHLTVEDISRLASMTFDYNAPQITSIRDIEQKASDKVKPLEEKYPLLFARVTTEAIVEYIEMTNQKHAKKGAPTKP